VIARFRGPQVLPVLDQGQLELVKFKLGDHSKGRFERLPREAECATGDEHSTLLIRPREGSAQVTIDSLLAFAVDTRACTVPGGSTDRAGRSIENL
jgi:hypothetical protein